MKSESRKYYRGREDQRVQENCSGFEILAILFQIIHFRNHILIEKDDNEYNII